MIESTVSRGADVTSSAPARKSTWQLGVKHSITKRCTQGRCWEVRLWPMAGPRRVQTPPAGLSALVDRGLMGVRAKRCMPQALWLKSAGSVQPIRVSPRCISSRVPAAPMRPRARPAAPATTDAVVRPVGVAALCWDAAALRGNAVVPQPLPGRPAFRLAKQHTAHPCHRREPERRPGGPAERGAVHDEDDRYQDAAEGGPAHHVAHRVTRRRLRGGRGLLGPCEGARRIKVNRFLSRTPPLLGRRPSLPAASGARWRLGRGVRG